MITAKLKVAAIKTPDGMGKDVSVGKGIGEAVGISVSEIVGTAVIVAIGARVSVGGASVGVAVACDFNSNPGTALFSIR